MNPNQTYWTPFLVLTGAIVAGSACYDTRLPAKLDVELPSERVVAVDADSGPLDLAGSRWDLYGTTVIHGNNGAEVYAGGEPLLIGELEVGENGEVLWVALGEIYYEDILVPAWLGEVVYADALPHPAAAPGTSYVAESYGYSDGDEFTVTVLLRYFIGPLQAFTGSLTAAGTLSEEQDRLEGTLEVKLSTDIEVWNVDLPPEDMYTIECYAERR